MTALAVLQPYDPVKAGASCHLCPLKGNTIVPPKPAYLPAKVVFVGEAPGRKEEIQAQPFVGMTGQFLRSLCREVDIDFREAALQNAALCRSELDKENEEAAVCCAPRLLKELAAFDPSIPIVTLGKSSTLSVLGVRSILRSRGFVWTAREVDALSAWSKAKKAKTRGAPKWKELRLKAQIAEGRSALAGRTVFPTVHPAFVLRSDTWLPILKIDLDRVARWLRGELTREMLVDNGPYVVVTRREDVRRELKKLGPDIDVDVETGASVSGGNDGADPLRNRLLCVGISDGDHTVVIWPWRKATHAPLVNACLKRSKTVGNHNGYNFDQIVLDRCDVPFEPIDDKLRDTLIEHHTFASHMPQRLSHVASCFVDVGPWKVTFKQGTGGATEKGLPPEKLDPKDLCRYNCLRGDTRVVLADGSTRKLQDIVDHRERPLVLAHDDEMGIVEARVTGWSKTVVSDQKWVRIKVEGSDARAQGLIATPDHEVRTGRGWIEAKDVRVGDFIAQPERYLTPLERDALVGTLLGDSHMTFSPTRRSRKNTAETASVAGSNVEGSRLAQHKSKCTRGFIVVDAQPEKPGSGAYINSQPMFRYRTPMSAQVAALRPLVYDEDGRKRLRASTLNSLGPVGLAWWFMDDGCIQKGRKRRHVGGTPGRKGARGTKLYLDAPERDSITLATNCFSREDVDEAVKWFRVHLGHTSAGQDRVIRLGPLAARRFCRIIAPFVPSSMRYKFPRKAALYVGGVKASWGGDDSLGPWPKYSDKPLSERRASYYARVVEAGPFDPPRKHSWQRTAAKTRYCLTVKGTGNFFTTSGLVHNSADARIQARTRKSMRADLESELAVYDVDRENARLCRQMIIDGIGVDLERRTALLEAMTAKEADLLDRMRKLLRRANFHPMQLKEVRKALFTTLRAPMEIADPTDSGLPSTSQKTLERLKTSPTRAGRFADLLLQWRGVVKIKSTYLVSQVLDKPSRKTPHFTRTHFNWRSYGAASGRYSCRLQSCPRAEYLKDKSIVLETRVREVYVADPGCQLVYFDLSQAELRFAAYLSGDAAFIAACESGDVHTATAKLLFPTEAELIGRDPKGAGKPFRDVEKNCIFGFIYYAQPETIFIFVRSKGLPVEMRDVVNMHDMVHSVFARYFRYVEENKRRVDKDGYMRCALSGRISWLGWHAGISDVANRPIQGGIASLMNVRLPQIRRRLPPGARVVAQIHDAAIMNVPNRHVDRVQELVKTTWEEPVIVPANGYGSSLRVEDGARSFVMPIELKVKERWGDFG